MRIVYTSILNPWDPRHGGGQRAVDELARVMAGRGHEVDVIYSGIGGAPTADLPYRTHVLPHHERLYLNALEFARFLRRLKLRGGVVHANGYEGAFLRYVAVAPVAFVVSSHHPDPPSLLDVPGPLEWIERARWTRQRIIPLMERWAFRCADLVTSPSAFAARSLRERGYVASGALVEVVPHGTPSLPPVRAREDGAELVCVARLDYHKGIDVLLRALSALSKTRLDLVGTGPEERELRRIATELGLNDRVRFRGHLDRPGVAAVLAGAMALVLPSRSDNLPLVILEAMQAGLPVVATAVGGIPEEVRHEEEGLLVPPEDPRSLAEALARVICDSALRQRMAAAGRARAAVFTWERAAERYENLYASVLGDPEQRCRGPQTSCANRQGPRDVRTGLGQTTALSTAAPRASLASSVAYVGLVNVIAFFAGVVRQKLFAAVLSPRGLGGFSLAASFFELYTIVVGLGASVGVLREFTRALADGHRSRAARVFRDVQRIVIVFSLALGGALSLLAPAITARVFAGILPWWTIPTLVAAAPAVLAGELRHSAINGLGQPRILAVSSVTTVLLGLGVTVWLVVTFELAGAILQLAAGALIGLLVSQSFLSQIFRPQEHNPERVPLPEACQAVAGAFRVGAATALQHLAVTTNLFVFRSAVVVNLGAFANGLYHGTMALSRQYTATISAGVFVYLYPRLAELAGHPRSFARELSNSVGFVLALVVPASLVLIATRDWIVGIVFTPEFSPMVPLMLYSFSGDVLILLTAVLRIALLASGRARSYIVVGLLDEAVYLGAFLGGLHFSGLTGATQAYLASGATGMALYGAALWRRGELILPARRVLQLLLAVSVVGAAMMRPPNAWTSRVLALSLAVGWLGVWHRELLSGLRD